MYSGVSLANRVSSWPSSVSSNTCYISISLILQPVTLAQKCPALWVHLRLSHLRPVKGRYIDATGRALIVDPQRFLGCCKSVEGNMFSQSSLHFYQSHIPLVLQPVCPLLMCLVVDFFFLRSVTNCSANSEQGSLRRLLIYLATRGPQAICLFKPSGITLYFSKS